MRLQENIIQFKKMIDLTKRVFILGTGSSLLDIPSTIFKKLKNEFTIGLTYSYKTFMPNCLIWGDQHFTDFVYKEQFENNPIFVMRNNAFNQHRYNDRIDFRVWLDSMVDYKFDESNYTGILTSSWLLQILENYKGIIYLIGFDFYPGHSYTEEQVGYDPALSWVTNNPDKAVEQHKGFKMKIYNCNEASLLKCYPKINISEVL